MEIKHNKKIENLSKSELNTLINLYYDTTLVEDENLLNLLIEKNLVSSEISKNKNKLLLTDTGLDLCGTLMIDKIEEKKNLFEEKTKDISERALSCLVNRIIYNTPLVNESGHIEPVNEAYSLDENHWYERVLLKDDRFIEIMNQFYDIVEDLGFVKRVDSEIYSSPEIEEFLKNRYKDVMDLSWSEEDSLKYYYFFYIYAQDQKNLINFAGCGEEYRSMFYGEETSPPDYWYSSNRSNPRSLLSNLGISEKRVLGFLSEMEEKEIVNERSYPLSSFSFFSANDKIYVIQDIKKYMEYCKVKFLDPVVESLI